MADKIIYTQVFDNSTEIRLYEETIQHIKDGHPEVPIELPSLDAALSQAIVNPTHVEKSYGNAYVFIDVDTTNASGDPLRVPVKMMTPTSGRVRTAYFASTNSSGSYVYTRKTDGNG